VAYFANSSEGDIFDSQCADCPLGYGWNEPTQTLLFDPERVPRPCPVALVQLQFNYDQCDNKKLEDAMNCLVNKVGICQVRQQLLQIRESEKC